MSRALPLLIFVACGGAVSTSTVDAVDAGPSKTGTGTSTGSTSATTLPTGEEPDETQHDGGYDIGRGCATNGECGTGEYCQRSQGHCAGSGVCALVPTAPPPPYCHTPEWCGCDGKDYCGPEYAALASTNIAVPGPCTFACGDKTCTALDQYCQHSSGGAQPLEGGTNDFYECVTFANACVDDRSCKCVAPSGGASGCTETDGHVQVDLYLP